MSDAVRKAIAEIGAIFSREQSKLGWGDSASGKLDAAISRALATCDELCVWKFSGPIRYPACRANEPWAAEIVEQFACCPYCGRKIKEADDGDA